MERSPSRVGGTGLLTSGAELVSTIGLCFVAALNGFVWIAESALVGNFWVVGLVAAGLVALIRAQASAVLLSHYRTDGAAARRRTGRISATLFWITVLALLTVIVLGYAVSRPASTV